MEWAKEGADSFPPCYEDLREVFEARECDVLPPHRETDCAIQIEEGAPLPKSRLYSMTPKELATLKEFIEKNLARGFIRPSTSTFAAPVFFRQKKDASLRLVTDYRNLNGICSTNKYPLPLMKDMLGRLVTGKIFTKLDLRDAYYRVRIKEGDEYKTAFNCPLGAFEYLVMPFGLSGAPGVFMRHINEVLHDLLFEGVLVYLDDVLIYSEDLNSHIKLVREVLKRLLDNQLYVKLSKCHFHTERLDFLGYRVSSQGIEMDPAKVQTVLDWAPPRNRKDVQKFLGFANFYRQFIPDFARIALPITDLLKTKLMDTKGGDVVQKGGKGPKPSTPIKWSEECQRAFDQLKLLFSSEPILLHPDPDKPFVVQVDASDCAMGAVLLQRDQDDKLRPCAYLSRRFQKAEIAWPCWEKEAYAVKHALDSWRQFLEGALHPFEVWTDHRNLEALQTPRKLTPKQRRWAKDFYKYRFKLKFFPGRQNILADALSRLPQHMGKDAIPLETIFSPEQLGLAVLTRSKTKALVLPSGPAEPDATLDDILLRIRQAVSTDDWFRQHKDLLSQNAQGLWVRKSKIYVPTSLREDILKLCHDSKAAGHWGYLKTWHKLRNTYWWEGVRAEVEAYVKSCPVCARAKPVVGKPRGLLHPLPTPEGPWKHIAMDFITDLPPSKGRDTIWVVVDLFSKQAHYVACKGMPSAPKLADMFISHIYKYHGLPDRIISDRGSTFTSKFWQVLQEKLGVQLALSTAYHPESDGQCEKTNMALERYLRSYTNYLQDDWYDLLPHAEVAFNSAVHRSTGQSPFLINYGFEPKLLPALPAEKSDPISVTQWSEKVKGAWPLVTKALHDAKKQYKRFADRKRSEGWDIKPGDMVYLSTKNLKSRFPSKKLGPKFIGPFPVKRLINDVTAELVLPKSYRHLHPVFHFRLLKPDRSTGRWKKTDSPPLPMLIDGQQHFEVAKILDSRWHKGKLQYLIRWKHFPVDHDEWVYVAHVNAPDLVARFHAQYPDKPSLGSVT